MKIGSITSTSGMSAMQMTGADLKDHKTKNIQNEITSVKQQMQKISSKEDLSASEKTNERKKLRKEISSLDTELKQHQDELLKSQKREQMLSRLREDQKPAKEESSEDKIQSKESVSTATDSGTLPTDERKNMQPGTVISQNSDGTVILKEILGQDKKSDMDKEEKDAVETKEENSAKEEAREAANDTAADTDISGSGMHAMVSADASLQQANRQGTVVTRTSDGIAVLKGEMKLDESRGVDTERKQDALEKMQRQEQRALAFQFSILGNADDAMKSAAASVSAGSDAQDDTGSNISANALFGSAEDPSSQQKFNVSIV